MIYLIPPIPPVHRGGIPHSPTVHGIHYTVYYSSLIRINYFILAGGGAYSRTDKWEVRGVASLGRGGCERGSGVSIYVDVFAHLDLINYLIN